MVRIIVSIVLLLVLAALVVFNVDYRTTVNLFGREVQDVSVVVFGIIAFVAGALYSFFIYVASFARTRRRRRLGVREGDVRDREDEIELRSEAEAPPKQVGSGKFLGIFGRKKEKIAEEDASNQVDDESPTSGAPGEPLR